MIDQRFCKYIKTIAQYHSFSRAAQVLYVSQPALSRFVKKVEDELGVTLFDRDTIPLRLTLAGQRYLEYVEQFQGLERNMRQEFSAMGKQSFNRLTIATLPLLGIYVLPRIVPDFAEQFPSVDQKIVECSSAEILKQLDHDDVDLVLTNLRPDNPHLRYERLMGDPVVLATQYDEQMQQYYPDCGNNLEHPLQVDLSQFEQQTLIVLRAWQNMRIVAETICRHYSFAPQRVVEVPSLSSALSLVGCGRGMTFICPSYVHCIQPQTPLIYFSLPEVATLTDIVAVSHRDNQNPLVDAFCQCAMRKLHSCK